MCTAVVSVDPASRFPVLVAGVRDEFVARAWQPPGRYWQDHSELIGGRDTQAGGTWLAVDPGAPRLACVLNGRGRMAPEEARTSRGVLPLLAAASNKADDALAELELTRFDPFHLVYAAPETAWLWTWDGEDMVEQPLGPGLHIVVNSGLEGADLRHDGPGSEEMSARVAHFRARLMSARRPEPYASAPMTTAWGEWLPLIDGDGLDPADPRALIVRRDFGDGRIWGTTSTSLVALTPSGVRYDFSAEPGDPAAWQPVIVG
jgi:uncharacterized protein with NRDE domain